MNLKTYTLSVSLASMLGMLISIVPLVRHIFEYVSPSPSLTPADLVSPITNALAQGRFEAGRSATAGAIVAYSILFVVCAVLFTVHLRWGLRLSRERGNDISNSPP